MTTTIPNKRPPRLVLALSAAAVAAVASLWWLAERSSATTEYVGAATAEVPGHGTYEFELTTCDESDEDFVAAGPTTTPDGTVSWLHATSDGVQITAGTASEIDPPIDGHLWLASDDLPRWSEQDEIIVARTVLSDHRLPGSTSSQAVITIACDEV